MRTWILIASLLMILAGCGDDDGPATVDAGTDAGMAADADMDAAADTDAGTDAATDTDAAKDTDTGADTGPPADAPIGGIGITLEEVMTLTNCMPIVGMDPIRASWTVVIDNPTASPLPVTVESARILLDGPTRDPMEPIVVDPTSIMATPGESRTPQMKVSSPMPAAMPCLLCGGGTTLTVEVTFMAGVSVITATSTPVPYECVF